MKIPELSENLSIISQLGNNPGTDDGLSADELKAKFDEAVLIIQRYINQTLLLNINASVSPEDGLTMRADIAMDNHRVKDVAAPEEDGDSVNLGYMKDHTAPAGYVEASHNIASESELDAILIQKLSEMKQYDTAFLGFRATTNAIFEGIRVVCMLHKTEDGYGCAEFVSRGSKGAVAWRKSIYNNAALPIEWENPTMVPGVEYRTTERWNGKPVYAKLVNIGALPNASSRYIEGEPVPPGINAISIHGVGVSGYNSIPIQSSDVYASVQGEWGVIYVSTTSDYSAYTGYLTVKYTKN